MNSLQEPASEAMEGYPVKKLRREDFPSQVAYAAAFDAEMRKVFPKWVFDRAETEAEKPQNTQKGVKCPLCDHYMAYEEDRDCDGNHLQRPWYECEQCEWKQPVDSQSPIGNGQGEQAGPDLAARGLRLRDGRPEACATATLTEARTSMLRFCAWCTAFMGSKPGEGVTHGICAKCQAVIEAEAYSKNLSGRPVEVGGSVSSVAIFTRTSLAESPIGAHTQRHEKCGVLPADRCLSVMVNNNKGKD